MTPRWDDVNARARGLGARLLTGPQLRLVAEARDPTDLAGRLARHGYSLDGAGWSATIATLDRAVGRVAGDRLTLLARRLGPRRRRVRGLFEAGDRDALRAMVRGIAHGAAPEVILGGITPTFTLPERTLDVLARVPSLELLGRRLEQLGHPYHAVFRREPPSPAEPDNPVLRLELGLRRCYAERTREGARRGGKTARRLAAEVVDQENLATLLLADAWGVELAPESLFVKGGQILFRERFMAIASQADLSARRVSLARAFRQTTSGAVLADPGLSLAGIELGLRRARLRAARQAARTDPLGVAVLAWTVLRIEAEAHNLRRILHGLALDAPPATTAAGWTTSL